MENNDIGSTADYRKFGSDLAVRVEQCGELQVSYAYFDGEYKNNGGTFKMCDHLISGDILSRSYYDFQAGIGGAYTRSRLGPDVESSQLRFTGIYNITERYRAEVVYSVFNFDDYADPSPIYSQYYTANVVELSVSYDF